MAATKAFTVVTDWTAVAQNAVGESGLIDLADGFGGVIGIQAFLDTETAHASGTEFLLQVRNAASGDEDWHTLFQWTDLIGTANAEPLTNNTGGYAPANTTVFTCASTTGYTAGDWRAIKDGTLVNSELFWQVAVSAATSVTSQDGSTNQHATNTPMYNIAISKAWPIGVEYAYARVLVNNTKTAAGSTLNYRVTLTEITAIS